MLAASAGMLKLECAFRTQLGSGRQTKEDESFKNVGEDYYVSHISVLSVEERFPFPAPMNSEVVK